MLRFDAERAAAGLPPLPSLLMAPGIDLALQNAKEHQVYERSTEVLRGAAARPFFYVVCSAGESAAPCGNVRVISLGALGAEMDRHAEAGKLGLCRFFTTYEGGGAFWVAARRHALRRGLGPLDPVFGAFVRDEVHRACGADTAFSYGLNVPAEWSASYTATEAILKKRQDAVRRELQASAAAEAAAVAAAAEAEGASEDEFAFDDPEAESSGSDCDEEEEQRLIHMDKANIWVQAFDLSKAARKAAAAGDPAAANRASQRNLPLLSHDLWFKPLPPGSDVAAAVEAAVKAGLDPDLPAALARLAAALARRRGEDARPLAVFQVEPSPGQEKRWDPVYNSRRREFAAVRYVPPGAGGADLEDYDVLGLQLERDELGRPRFCARRGAARGLATHDCSAFDPERNLVGPVVYSFGFAKCFAAGCLAPARFAYLRRDPLAVPADDVVLRQEVERWMGVADAAPGDGGADDARVRVQDPSKFNYNLSRVGVKDVGGTAHEFWSMSQLLDLMDPGPEGGALGEGAAPVRKAIVFAGHKNEVAYRCLRVFGALLELRRVRHVAAGRAGRAELLGSLFAAHVHHELAYEERQRRIWRFRDAPCGVLFNVNLLSTGVDIPCVDCVHLLRPSLNSNVILQRFGRALRLDPAAPGKVATLVAPCVDPYELEDLQAEGALPPRAADVDERYDLILAAAEAMMDPGLRSLGRAFFDAGGGRRVATGGDGEDGDEDGDGAEPRAGHRGRSALLQLLVARHGAEAAQTLELGAGDALLLQGIFRACGRPLLSQAAGWLVKLEELAAHVAAHGVLPPQSHPSLGSWINNQRVAYKAWKAGKPCSATMDDERAAALEAVKGWTWDGADYDAAFQAKLEALTAHVAAHGALPLKTHPSLGNWIGTQRRAYKSWKEGKPCNLTMDEERAAALEAVEGWTWAGADYNAAWQAKLEELRAYVAAHKALPLRSHPSLGSWIGAQRAAYKAWKAGKPCSNTMDDERAAALEAVEGWAWDHAASWQVTLEELRAYVGAHGALPLKTHPSLGNWIATQRAAYKAWTESKPCSNVMDNERAAALEAVEGWTWVGRDDDAVWQAKLEELTAHIAEHGALPLLSHPSLGMWISNQRVAYKAWKADKPSRAAMMDNERAAALEAVEGWAWVGKRGKRTQ